MPDGFRFQTMDAPPVTPQKGDSQQMELPVSLRNWPRGTPNRWIANTMDPTADKTG